MGASDPHVCAESCRELRERWERAEAALSERTRERDVAYIGWQEEVNDLRHRLEAAQARADALQARVKQLESFIDGHGLTAPGEERRG